MFLNGQLLDAWLLSRQDSDIPDITGDVRTRYAEFARQMVPVHEVVVSGAQLIDGGLLTGHGIAHINRVIQRASQLLEATELVLTSYEVFLLLVAINLHDAGNMYGRAGHEQRIEQVLDAQGIHFETNGFERNLAIMIATAHGGKADSIDNLPSMPERFNGQKIRVRVLAALLKLADELSDDRTRAAKALMNAELLTDGELVFHTFANVLDTVDIRHGERTVDLYFKLTTKEVLANYRHKGKAISLLKYIYSRTLKTHFERSYCMRFLRPGIELEAINVVIDIFNDKYRVRKERIKYKLEEKGYPNYDDDIIYKICPELKLYRPTMVMAKLGKAKRPNRKKVTRGKNGKK
jgi:hypothetical protein